MYLIVKNDWKTLTKGRSFLTIKYIEYEKNSAKNDKNQILTLFSKQNITKYMIKKTRIISSI